MDRGQLKSFMALLMCSDPWPTGNTEDQEILDYFANTEARKHGFGDWIEAYHAI